MRNSEVLEKYPLNFRESIILTRYLQSLCKRIISIYADKSVYFGSIAGGYKRFFGFFILKQ